MNEEFLVLLEQLELKDKQNVYQGTLLDVTVNETNNCWSYRVQFLKPLPLDVFQVFEEKFEKLPHTIESCQSNRLTIEYLEVDYDYLEGYYDHVLRKLAKKRPRFNAILDFDIEQNGEKINIVCPKDGMFVNGMLNDVKSHLLQYGFDVFLAVRVCEESPMIKDRIIQEADQFSSQTSDLIDDNEPIRYESFNDSKIRNITHQIDELPITEQDLNEYKSLNNNAKVVFEGEITHTESFVTKKKTHLFTWIVSNEDDSIYVKKFVKRPEEIRFMEATKVGMLAKVSGNMSYDLYAKEVTVTAISLQRTTKVVQKEMRRDNAPQKRIELDLHSKMSTLDGITSVTDYVNVAKKWGHDAIALTDHNTVQGFPELFKATKDKSIKPIYGCEFSFVDEQDLDVIKHPIDLALNDAIYTVFDIETTGLSLNHDKIIEIAAVKLHKNQIIEEYSAFVNPEQTLSMLTTKITSIQNKDVALAPTIDQVIPEFKAFIEGTVLVAHNAHFDVGFIEKALKDNGLFDQPYPVIDTLSIARNMFGQDLKRFNLKAVSRFFKVHLEQHHRAIYDTRATAEVFLHMLKHIREVGITNLNQMPILSEKSEGYKYAIPHHINVLVQNQVGLKNLYKLVSLANTVYFHKEPRLLKRVLNQHREGLLVGSGCMNSHLFEIAKNKSIDTLEEVASTFDFLEIQPYEDYLYLGEKMDHAEDVIKTAIQHIIEVGRRLNIPVVATGDVHHLNKSDKKYRDIYIQTPVVGGGLHPLAQYKDIPSQYFRTTDEMLQSFPFLDDDVVKELVISNPQKINERIEFVKTFQAELYAPNDDFLALEGIPSIENKVIKMVSDKAKEIYGRDVPQIVQERIDKEIKSITENKFSTIYFISHLLVKKSLDEGYLVGSRGSVGSSLVATLMNITEVNPLPPHYVCPKCHFSTFKMTKEEKIKYGLTQNEERLQAILDRHDTGFDLPLEMCPECGHELNKDGHSIPFETFLGFKGDKVPDIDLNFSGEYQPIVHEYIRSIFGKERAFRAGTISTVAEKTAFGYVKGFTETKNITLRGAEIQRIASRITGVRRSTGQHPGGIVVVPSYKDIYDVTPVQYPADDTSGSWRTTHFDYHSFEENLFKLDVLGHDDPTMIRFLMDYVNDHPLDFDFSEATEIPLDDPNIYSMLHSTESLGLKPSDINSEVASFGIPEMGTKFVRDMLTDSRPKTFADVVKISGLSHGTDVWNNNAKDLVTGQNKSFGKIPFKNVIGCRDDIMVYLIQNNMAEDVAFEISEFIRKGKAAFQPDKWEGYKQIMKENNVPDWYIWSCGKIKYMFPKAHATAYVMMALRIAWFKFYHPILFYSAYFSKRASDFDIYAFLGGEYEIRKKMKEIDDQGNQATDRDKRLYTVLEIALEMVMRGFGFKNIDIERSDATEFKITDDKKHLLLPFITVDGLGLKVANSVVEARKDGPFKTREDIKNRTSLSKTLFNKLDMLDVFEGLPENSQMNLFKL
jgi:DNA polymerase-3 subunit alpha (Gram-positive type)